MTNNLFIKKKKLFYRWDISLKYSYCFLFIIETARYIWKCFTLRSKIKTYDYFFFSRQSSSIRLDGCGKAGRVARSMRWWWISTSAFVPKSRRSRRRRCYSTIYGRIFGFTIGGLTGTTSVKFSLCWMWSVSDTIFFLDNFIVMWQITFS